MYCNICMYYLNISANVLSCIGKLALKARLDEVTSPVVAASLSKKGSVKNSNFFLYKY